MDSGLHILAGFLGSFAPYLVSTLEGRHDGDVISLTRLPVNNPNPMQSGRGVVCEQDVVSFNGGFRDNYRIPASIGACPSLGADKPRLSLL
jgi:hypothetical protein